MDPEMECSHRILLLECDGCISVMDALAVALTLPESVVLNNAEYIKRTLYKKKLPSMTCSCRCRCPLGTRPKPKKLICGKHAFIHLPL